MNIYIGNVSFNTTEETLKSLTDLYYEIGWE
jgi:hypothetical protein